MQQDPTATSTQHIRTGSYATTASPNHENGSFIHDDASRGNSSASARSRSRGSAHAVHGSRTPSISRCLSDEEVPAKQRLGQRITEYERALSRGSNTPQQPLGFKVIKRPDGSGNPEGAQLMDLPNEVLTRIVTQLRPDARAAASMVCKRLREVIMTPYAWQLAFMQHFPGSDVQRPKDAGQNGLWHGASDVQVSYEQPSAFARLTSQATWRSEFLLRSELMQGLSLGRPGIGKESGPGYYYKKARKSQGTLIYFPRRSSRVLTHLHVLYGKDTASRAMHGSRFGGTTSISDPSTGRVDRWGDEDDWEHLLLPDLLDEEPFGVGDGGVLHVPHPMDVSAAYGRLGGWGMPGGRAFFLGVHANTQRVSNRVTRYLDDGYLINDERLDLPHIADIGDGVSSVWLAKSSDVPATTRSMMGILVGTTAGIVTAYSLAPEGSPNKSALNGCISTRWVVSPGVPIVAFKIDDQYSVRRRRQGRIWAVALNALGEVFYLDAPPHENLHNTGEKTHAQLTEDAWEAGRTAPWHLLEHTRRTRKDGSAVQERELSFGRSAVQISQLSPEQLRREAEEVNHLCRLPYWHFRDTYNGWDMQRRLEVDFSSDDGSGAGELIFLMDSGAEGCGPARIQRFTRALSIRLPSSPPVTLHKSNSSPRPAPSIFGRAPSELTLSPTSSGTSSPMSKDIARAMELSHNWTAEEMSLAGHQVDQLTASTLDNSYTSLLTFSEDPLLNESRSDSNEGERSPLRAIPGGRARNLVVGTSSGAVLVWNCRARGSKEQPVQTLRVIQTTSKEITAVAATALYIVHGGSDGLAQAWDPLASTLEPLHTIHSKNSIQPSRHTQPGGRRLTKEDMNVVRAISVDPNPLLLRGCLTCGPGIHSWSFRSQDNIVKRKRRMRNIHGRPVNRRTGTEISEYIAGEEAEVIREQKERAAEFERLHRNFGLGELTEEEAIVYAQMLSQEAAEEERLRDQQALLLSESEAELARLARRSSDDDQISDDTASVDTGYISTSDVASSHDPLDQAIISQSPRVTYITSVADGRGVQAMYSPGGERSSDYPITYKARQDKHRHGKKNKRQGSSSASSTSGDAAGTSAISAGYSQYGHTANASFGSEGDFSVSGLSADEQLALALRLSAVEEEGENTARAGRTTNGNQDDEFPSLAPREMPGKGKGKAPTAVPQESWGQGLASTSGMTEDEELALALERSMQSQ
ncbi:hypothetical protein NLU13_4820 [Sarocladium strictum]|uniref:F-box domain-containing protein n=1 Tax=Sarocladium strictum TaxID=5046 RepID=A0AA39L913_SARSR|nr:hypothetical protein NLU13_4820 [Sarocladium strictum]